MIWKFYDVLLLNLSKEGLSLTAINPRLIVMKHHTSIFSSAHLHKIATKILSQELKNKKLLHQECDPMPTVETLWFISPLNTGK